MESSSGWARCRVTPSISTVMGYPSLWGMGGGAMMTRRCHGVSEDLRVTQHRPAMGRFPSAWIPAKPLLNAWRLHAAYFGDRRYQDRMSIEMAECPWRS